MPDTAIRAVEALRLPGLLRAICGLAGVPVLPGQRGAGDAFVLRTGPEPPGLFADLLEEALLDDAAEAEAPPDGGGRGHHTPAAGHIAVEAGYGGPCPDAEGLARAAAPDGGRVLLFAVERREAGAEGHLLGVTWAALPDGEPAPTAPLRAAVLPEAGPPR